MVTDYLPPYSEKKVLIWKQNKKYPGNPKKIPGYFFAKARSRLRIKLMSDLIFFNKLLGYVEIVECQRVTV